MGEHHEGTHPRRRRDRPAPRRAAGRIRFRRRSRESLGHGGSGASALVLDAADATAVRTAAEDVDTVFLVTSPERYGRWAELWPPVVEAVLAGSRGRDLVTMGNLYAYGRARMPMTENSPFQPAESKGAVRAESWRLIKAAHDRGELRAVEVRASDYFGPGVGGTSMLGERFFGPLLAGRTARIVGAPDQPHSWTYLDDIGATLAAAANYRGDWGRAWHVPCSAPLSPSDVARDVAKATGVPGTVGRYPSWFFGLLAAVSPDLRAVRESSYMFEAPFVIDATETERELGVSATPWEHALAATIEGYRRSGR